MLIVQDSEDFLLSNRRDVELLKRFGSPAEMNFKQERDKKFRGNEISAVQCLSDN